MIFTLASLLFINLVTSFQEIDLYNKHNLTSGHHFHENILCRGCGNEITFSGSIISKISPLAQHSFYDSIFSEDEVLVQVLLSDFFLPYSMITTSHSNCVGISEWEQYDSWFPGYHWKPCVCPDCGALVGWVFEPINPMFVEKPDTFFGLLLSNLIGESFVNSLTVIPEAQKN